MFKRNIFGQILWAKKLLISLFGWATHPTFNWVHKVRISGTENLKGLPKNNVLIVSNHQTYFAEVALMYHVLSAVKWGFRNKISNPVYLFNPIVNLYYVAARETMKANLLTKIFEFAGAITVQRTWREAGKDIKRQVNLKDYENIGLALQDGWVITFPQGTTKPFMQGRRGTSHIIKNFKPVVIPVNIDGFRRAFDKKGMRVKKEGSELSIRFLPPLEIDYEAKADVILKQIMEAIKQTEDFLQVDEIPEKEDQ